MTLTGAVLGLPTGYSHSLYQAVANDPAPVLWGAGAGFALGLIFGAAIRETRVRRSFHFSGNGVNQALGMRQSLGP
jgi:hypothetical protein